MFKDSYKNRRNVNKKLLLLIENNFIKRILQLGKPDIFFIKAKS